MKKTYPLLIALLVILSGCDKDTSVPVPSAGPNSIMDETHPIPPASRPLMEGVYTVTDGAELLGSTVILKWNRTSLSVANSNGKYMVLQVGHLDSVVFLQGYWRNGYSDETGLISMYIPRDEGGTTIVTGNGSQSITLYGAYGKDSGLPDEPIVLNYQRPFSDKVKNSNFYILAHRSGGRTSDRLPVSENSIEMINYTEKFGSTGIEIDVRMSKDGVPFIYHDPDINTRLTKKGPLAGDINQYTWLQLSTFVQLIHGEKIPTLEEALTFTIDSTLLRFVYLDTKESNDVMSTVIPLQQKMIQRARDKGRDILIVIGIPTEDVLNDLKSYPNYQEIPSLCELTVDDVRAVNSVVWAPRWTLGTQNDLVAEMHNENRLAVCWTIDQVQWIKEFINDGHFDGLLTNYPYVVAYYHYIQQ